MSVGEQGNPEITRTFKMLGGEARKKSDLSNAIREINWQKGKPAPAAFDPSGEPDYKWLLPPMGGYIEAKAAVTNFPFSAISPEQRDWLTYGPPPPITEMLNLGWVSVNFIWIWMGRGRANAKADPREAYLVPWADWLCIEGEFRGHGLVGIPHRQPHKLEHRELGLNASNRLCKYVLEWAGGHWRIPSTHPFWRVTSAVSFFAPQGELPSTQEQV